jgi:hypothetical protein
MPTRNSEAIVAAWCALDRAGAVLAADRDIVDATRSVRTVIAEFALAGGADEEIFDACASLGRLIAQGGGSPTLASLTIDHASVALGTLGAVGRPWIASGRAAVAEGFTLGLLERVQRDALRSWDFPRCAVRMPGGMVAIAAGLPSDDPELLREWAGLIAKGAALEGVRQAFVAGPDAPRAAVEDALDLVGIRVVTP